MHRHKHIRRILFGTTLLLLMVFIATRIYYSLTPQMNVILISIDTLRPDHMGVYGYARNTTPNIDAFAKNATVFTQAYTVIPMTEPSFTALLTGKSPFNTRVITNGGIPVSSNVPTLATILKKVNYITATFTTGIYPKAIDLGRGFDTQEFYQYKYYSSKNNSEYYTEGDNRTYDNLIQHAVNWLHNNRKTKFFLWVHLLDPHAPYIPPRNIVCKFLTKSECQHVSKMTQVQIETLRAQYQQCQEKKVPPEVVSIMRALYDAEILNADRLEGELLNQLKKDDNDKKTVVVIYGDHGEGFDHNYYFNHREVLYNSAVHIPLIIKDPEISHSGTESILLQNIDILPTLLDLLHVSKKDYLFDGKSFASLFSNNPLSQLRLFLHKREIYASNSTWTKFSVSDGAYSYIYSLPGSCRLNGQAEELYNIVLDPGEERNLITGMPEVAARMKNDLFNYLSRYNLPQATPINKNENAATHEKALQDIKGFAY